MRDMKGFARRRKLRTFGGASHSTAVYKPGSTSCTSAIAYEDSKVLKLQSKSKLQFPKRAELKNTAQRGRSRSDVDTFYLDADEAHVNSPRDNESPERNLWSAVLMQGLAEMERGSDLDRRWCESQSKNTPGDFLWICEVLNLDGESLRRMIREIGLERMAKGGAPKTFAPSEANK